MGKAQLGRVQRLPPQRQLVRHRLPAVILIRGEDALVGIELVTDDGMAEVIEVRANLVLPPRLRPALD